MPFLGVRLGMPSSYLGGGTGAAPVPWTPLQLNVTNPGTLLAWWDAQDSPHIALSGSNVTSWTDKVGGIVASQATSASQPTWSATARNSKPGIVGSGSQVLGFSPSALPSGTSTLSIAVAGYVSTSGSDVWMFSFGDSSGTPNRAIGNGSSGSDLVRYTNGTTADTTTDVWSGNDRFVIWQDASGDTNWNVAVDGNAPVNNTAAATTLPTTGAAGFMFAWPDGSFQTAAGTLQQVLVLNRVLTLDEQNKLSGWESWYDGKAGSNLPSGHPYKSRAPYVSDP